VSKFEKRLLLLEGQTAGGVTVIAFTPEGLSDQRWEHEVRRLAMERGAVNGRMSSDQ